MNAHRVDRRTVASDAGIEELQLERARRRVPATGLVFRELSRSAHSFAPMPENAIHLAAAARNLLGELSAPLAVIARVGPVLLVALPAQIVLLARARAHRGVE